MLVAGAGGFIGGHLVRHLLTQGHSVRGVDIKPLSAWFQLAPEAENNSWNLEEPGNCKAAVRGVDRVYNLACNMGGIGFITQNKSACMYSVLVNTNLIRAAVEAGVSRYFFSSTACVYNTSLQSSTTCAALKEEDAYPALPEEGYGWEKLFSERLCQELHSEGAVDVRIARLHNVYGPHGSYNDGREKAPASICRKVAQAKLSGGNSIEIWGNGLQTRSFMYIDDCLTGIDKIMASDVSEPVNLGSSQSITISRLVDIAEQLAGIKLIREYQTERPVGVMGRNSDNTKIKSLLGWEPTISVEQGLVATYEWIYQQCLKNRF